MLLRSSRGGDEDENAFFGGVLILEGARCCFAHLAGGWVCGILGRDETCNSSIPLRFISLLGFALSKRRARKFLMCKHNENFLTLLFGMSLLISHSHY